MRESGTGNRLIRASIPHDRGDGDSTRLQSDVDVEDGVDHRTMNCNSYMAGTLGATMDTTSPLPMLADDREEAIWRHQWLLCCHIYIAVLYTMEG